MRLADYLEKHSITLVDFAEKIGRSAATVSRVSRGINWPDRDTVKRIAEATDGAVTANDFAAEPDNSGRAA